MDAQDEKDDAIKRVQMRLEPCTLMTQAINHRKQDVVSKLNMPSKHCG